MPPMQNCPHCGALVADWFREWYLPLEQSKIYRGELAADCPKCHRGVALNVGVVIAPPSAPVLARSRSAAENWLKIQKTGLYSGLHGFLQSNDPAAVDYRTYQFRP